MKTREELFTMVKQELVVHEAIEEEIFYPALKQHPKTKEITLQAYEEHRVVNTVLAEIEGVSYDDEKRGRELQGHEGEPRASHRGGRGRDVQQAKQVFDEDELAQLGESHDGAKGGESRAA